MKSKQWKSAGLICLVFIGGLSSCTNGGQGSKGDALDAQPIVGSVEILNGDSVWVCNQSAIHLQNNSMEVLMYLSVPIGCKPIQNLRLLSAFGRKPRNSSYFRHSKMWKIRIIATNPLSTN